MMFQLRFEHTGGPTKNETSKTTVCLFPFIHDSLQLGFPIGIPLHGIARNCAELHATALKLRARNCVEFTWLAIAGK